MPTAPARRCRRIAVRPAMNLPTEVPALEAELACVRAMCDEDEKRVAQSATPEIDRIFLGSTQKLRREIERRLQWARRSGNAGATSPRSRRGAPHDGR